MKKIFSFLSAALAVAFFAMGASMFAYHSGMSLAGGDYLVSGFCACGLFLCVLAAIKLGSEWAASHSK